MAAGALLTARGAGKDVKIIGTVGLPEPVGGIEAVAKGRLGRATFTYPTGARSRCRRRSCSTAGLRWNQR
ncbi:msr8219 [Mesorhizobium japonicum MAFF 303099]|uniref:Msr8219 protein n=1 Tax=Mesorhizobium japonicum (strain LMG 29417 / CECT 9101 / MAFF 303099) TaxID=266835 RepID=Q983R0_RHILO|nr:msr8219 [Mesorhizobium japonicum MAFF 303099]